MAVTQGPVNPASGSTTNFGDSGSVLWTDPQGAAATDTTTATVSPASRNAFSNTLWLRDFGFTVPAGSTILGFLFTIDCTGSANNRHAWHVVRLQSSLGDAGKFGDDKGGAPISSGYTTYSFGGATDLWGAALTPEMVNSSNFGVGLKVIRTGTASTTTAFTSLGTVYYEPPAAAAGLYKGSTALAGLYKGATPLVDLYRGSTSL